MIRSMIVTLSTSLQQTDYPLFAMEFAYLAPLL